MKYLLDAPYRGLNISRSTKRKTLLVSALYNSCKCTLDGNIIYEKRYAAYQY